jgi:hypothetical protein
MNIRISNGEREIKLTKGEAATLRKARALSFELSKQGSGDAAGSAMRAYLALDQVVDYFAPEGVECSPTTEVTTEPKAAKQPASCTESPAR